MTARASSGARSQGMTEQRPEPVAARRGAPSRRLTAALGLGLGALVALGAVLGPRLGETAAQPTTAEVDDVHAVLHRLEKTCARSRSSPAARTRLDRDVATILAFSRAYPEARFQIDDESGRTLSLLLVAREATRRCVPEASARLDAALPERYRTGTR